MVDQNVPPVTEPTDRAFDLRSLYVLFLRRQKIFLAVAAVIMALVVAFTLTRQPTYTATTSILIQPQQTNVLQDTPVGTPADSSQVDTQVEVLNSRYLAKRVALALKLQNDPEFNTTLKGDAPSVDAMVQSARPAATGADRLASSGVADEVLEDVVNVVQSRMGAKRNGLTYVIDVSFTSTSGAKAARIANTIAQEYILAQTEAKYNTARGANDWVTGRLNTLAREVQANEAAVQRYKVANNLLSAQGATMAEQEVSSLNQQITQARAELAEKQARLAAARQQVSRGGGGGDVAAALGSSVVTDLRRQRADVSRRQAELQTRYGPLHPDVKKVERELADMDRQIQEEIGRLLSSLQAEVDVAQQRLSSLEGSRSSAEGSLGSNNSAMVALNELQRKADASRAIYEAFLNRSKETNAQEGLQMADARIASPAEPPTRPTSPKKAVNFALGLLLAFGGGAAAVFLAENLDGALRTANEIESRLHVRSIGAIPLLPRSARQDMSRYVVDKPFSSFAEAFRNLRTSLKFASEEEVKVVAVTSALPGEGKTLTTTSLARSTAQSGSRVLLIDADLRRRMLTASLGLPVPKGLVEHLNGEVSLKDAVITDEVSGAHLLLLSDADHPSSDILSGPAFVRLLDEAREAYDLVLIDTAPVLAVAESRVVAALSDTTIFLLRWARTPRQAAAAAIDLLVDAGAHIAGACLTLVDLNQQSKIGYGDSLYYFGDYRKYYRD
jgi:capsular exopolysaccharide synthesis family protein